MNYTYLLVGAGLGGISYYAYNNSGIFSLIFSILLIFITKLLIIMLRQKKDPLKGNIVV